MLLLLFLFWVTLLARAVFVCVIVIIFPVCVPVLELTNDVGLMRAPWSHIYTRSHSHRHNLVLSPVVTHTLCLHMHSPMHHGRTHIQTFNTHHGKTSRMH